MASGGTLPEEQFLCSICLDVFTDPVSTPCGHNYCKACITGDMVKLFKSMRVKAEGEIFTCLVCLASYCEGHLDPHLRVASLRKHKLTEPVSNLEDRVCTKHDKMLELFCQPDQVCICFKCLKDDHVGHKAVPLEQAHREKAAQLQSATSGMKIMEEAKSNTVKEVKDSIQQSREESDSDISSINAFFAFLVDSLKCRQSELIGVIQEKQKEAETEAEGRVAQLEKELAKLRRRRSKMEQLLQTEDHLLLLQNWPSLHLPTHTEDLFSPAPQQLPDSSPQIYAGIVKKAVERMEKDMEKYFCLFLCDFFYTVFLHWFGSFLETEITF
uniref:B box-type domain-containing protein n=1 Tax=Salarias fasciatus TaxID=181472 RepID=A0A672JMR2_SALFA